MTSHADVMALLAVGLPPCTGPLRLRRRWYRQSGAGFETIDVATYDPAGRLLRLVEVDPWFQHEYAHDEQGRIVRVTHAPVAPGDPNPPTIDEYFHDDAGRIVRTTVFHQRPTSETTFEYDAEGRVHAAHTRHLGPRKKTVATSDSRFFHDPAGRLRVVEELDSRGAWSVSAYHYLPALDLPVVISRRDADGAVTLTSFEYLEDSPAGPVVHNQDFAAVHAPLESREALSAVDVAALPPEQRRVEGVDLGADLEGKVVAHLKTGCLSRPDESPGDWFERALRAPTLSAVLKRRLVDAIHESLHHADPSVRVGALRALESSRALCEDRQLVTRIVSRWELFAKLRSADDDDSRDRGEDAARLVAARVGVTPGALEFTRGLALDPTYGLAVLAGLVGHDPEWVVKSIAQLVTPTLDPKGHRVSAILWNLRRDPDRFDRVVATLRGTIPDGLLNAAIGECRR